MLHKSVSDNVTSAVSTSFELLLVLINGVLTKAREF